MKGFIRTATLNAVRLISMGLSLSAWATDATLVLNQEPSATCQALAAEPMLSVVDQDPPSPGVIKTLVGPDGQRFAYRIGAGGLTLSSWRVLEADTVKPVQFTILKARSDGRARAFFFPESGTLSDSIEKARGPIGEVSFCYVPSSLPVSEASASCDASICAMAGQTFGPIPAASNTLTDPPSACSCDPLALPTAQAPAAAPSSCAASDPSQGDADTATASTVQGANLVGGYYYYCYAISGTLKCFRWLAKR